MNRLYERLNSKKFRQISTLLLLLCDFTILTYLYKRFTDKSMYDRLLQLTFQINPHLDSKDLTPALSSQLYELLTNSLLTALCFVLLYHLLVYFLWNKEKKFAANYIALYVWVAAPLTFLSFLMGITDNFMQALLFLFWSACFFYIALGLSRFPISPKKTSAK